MALASDSSLHVVVKQFHHVALIFSLAALLSRHLCGILVPGVGVIRAQQVILIEPFLEGVGYQVLGRRVFVESGRKNLLELLSVFTVGFGFQVWAKKRFCCF